MDPGIIKAGLSLVGGLFGGKKKGPDLVKMRDDALEAGFNPGTVLKATGGQGWMGGELTGGAFMANALKDGFDTWFNYQDEQQDREIADLQKQILQEELKDLQGAGEYTRDHGYDVPSIVTYADAVTDERPEMLSFQVDKKPNRRMDDTGIYGAGAEAPREFEADVWQWALDGTLEKNAKEVIGRNVPEGHDSWSEFWWGSKEKGFLGNRAIARAATKPIDKTVFDRHDWAEPHDLSFWEKYRN